MTVEILLTNLHLIAFPDSSTFSTSLQSTLIDARGTPNAPAGRPLFNMAVYFYFSLV